MTQNVGFLIKTLNFNSKHEFIDNESHLVSSCRALN